MRVAGSAQDKPILLLCALHDERDTFLHILHSTTELKREDLADDILGFLDIKQRAGKLVAVLGTFGTQGNIVARERTNELIAKYRPRLVVLFGIAAGVRERIKIGHVFITNEVWDLRKARILNERFEFEPSRLPSYPQHTFPFSVSSLRKDLKVFHRKEIEEIEVRDDLLCGSSDNLVRSTRYMDAAAGTHSKLGGVEREAAGVAESCRKHKKPFLIVKAVTDFGNLRKCDTYRILCCARAASAVIFSLFRNHVSESALAAESAKIEVPQEQRVPLLWPGVNTGGTNWMSVSDFDPQGLVALTKYTPYRTELPWPCKAIYESHLQARKNAEARGADYPFNGARYRVIAIAAHDRRLVDERVKVRVTFGDSDYFSFLSTSKVLDQVLSWPDGSKQTLREKYLSHVRDWPERVVSFLAHSFGLNILVVTSDRKAIIAKRSGRVALRTGMYHISVNEGLRRSDGKRLFDQRSRRDPTPQIRKAALRGIYEELGLNLPRDIAAQIRWTSLGLDPDGYQFALLGYVRLSLRSDELIAAASLARDRALEVRDLIPVDFNAKALSEFISNNGPWVAWGVETGYQALVSDRHLRREDTKEIVRAFDRLRATGFSDRKTSP